jgi:ABC-type dipeptide/oligopeptide/nickel transport system ATPase subunit
MKNQQYLNAEKLINYKYKPGNTYIITGNSNVGKTTNLAILEHDLLKRNVEIARYTSLTPNPSIKKEWYDARDIKKITSMQSKLYPGDKGMIRWPINPAWSLFKGWLNNLKPNLEYLLLDEPEQWCLDYTTLYSKPGGYDFRKRFIKIIKEITKKLNIITIIITHNKEIIKIADEEIIFSSNEITNPFAKDKIKKYKNETL